jgi:type IV pilus assembly protein PilA
MNKKGFTLIELLIVVVIIGILAAIAIPRFGETRERAFRSSVTSDLRNIQTLQEQYYFDNDYIYGAETDIAFDHSDGVEITTWTTTGSTGYNIVATHTAWDGSCTLDVSGTASTLTCQ